MSGIMKRLLKFAGGTAMAELAFLMALDLPQYITTCCRFCIDSDAGYMWVINLAIGLLAVIPVYVGLKEKKTRILFSIITFLASVLVMEFALWHRGTFSEIFVGSLNMDKIAGMIIGLIAGVIVQALLSRGDNTK